MNHEISTIKEKEESMFIKSWRSADAVYSCGTP
jgi:hypothetical protein